MADAVEILEKLVALGLGHPVPDFLEDELMPVGYYAADEGDVERGYVVFWIVEGVLWQKARAACSTLVKVA